MSKMAPIVSANIATQHLGVRAKIPYRPHEHSEDAAAHKNTDPYEGIERIMQMRWFIFKVKMVIYSLSS